MGAMQTRPSALLAVRPLPVRILSFMLRYVCLNEWHSATRQTFLASPTFLAFSVQRARRLPSLRMT